MTRALAHLDMEERATYCATYWRGQFERVSAVEFDRDRKMMSVSQNVRDRHPVHERSPEAILRRCTQVLTNSKGVAEPITSQLREILIEKYQTYARKSLRVLALAMRPLISEQDRACVEDEDGLTLLGFCGMVDPPRPEVKKAVDVCRAAGIRVVMVTETTSSLPRRWQITWDWMMSWGAAHTRPLLSLPAR